MKSILIIFGKSLILFSLLFLCYSLFFLNIQDIDFLKKIIYPSFFITTILTIIHVISSVKAGVKNNFSSVQSENINSEIKLDELIDKIEAKSNWKLIKQNSYSLVYKSNFNSLKSLGEVITIKHSQGQINVSSKPIFFTTIFDFGKNYENIKLISSIE